MERDCAEWFAHLLQTPTEWFLAEVLSAGHCSDLPAAFNSYCSRTDAVSVWGTYRHYLNYWSDGSSAASPTYHMKTVSSETRYTGNTDIGNHKTHFLDRQSVDCDGGALTGFRMLTEGSTIRYMMTCSTNVVFKESEGFDSVSQDDGGGNIWYLDRQWVDCGATGALKSFHYQRNGEHQGYYQYQCHKPNNLLQCQDRYTGRTDDGGGGDKIEFLDRQSLSCTSQEVMRGFGLQRHDGGIRYHFICCLVVGSADVEFHSQLSAERQATSTYPMYQNFWGHAEPNNQGGQHCGVLRKHPDIDRIWGYLDDVACDVAYPFVCARPSREHNGTVCLDSKCFKLFDHKVEWGTAVDRCENWGACLL